MILAPPRTAFSWSGDCVLGSGAIAPVNAKTKNPRKAVMSAKMNKIMFSTSATLNTDGARSLSVVV